GDLVRHGVGRAALVPPARRGARVAVGEHERGIKGKKMQKITTFLTFNGTAEEAVNLYTSVFNNSRVISTSRYGSDEPGMKKGAYMSGEFELEGQRFIALNGGPSFSFGEGMSLFVSCETQKEIDDYCAKLIAGGGEQG